MQSKRIEELRTEHTQLLNKESKIWHVYQMQTSSTESINSVISNNIIKDQHTNKRKQTKLRTYRDQSDYVNNYTFIHQIK